MLLRGRRAEAAERVLQVVFQMGNPLPGAPDEEARLVDDLRDLWNDPHVVETIESLETTLWAPPDNEYSRWIARRYVATWAQAFLRSGNGKPS